MIKGVELSSREHVCNCMFVYMCVCICESVHVCMCFSVWMAAGTPSTLEMLVPVSGPSPQCFKAEAAVY